MPQYAQVIVDQSGSRIFDYSIPEGVDVTIGSRVSVPVRHRSALATVVAVINNTEVENVRPISRVIGERPILNPLLIRLGHWIADYYCCSLEAAMRSILPQVIRDAEISHKRRRVVRLTRQISPEECETLEHKAPKQGAAIRALLSAQHPLPTAQLNRDHGVTGQAIQQLIKKGWIAADEEIVSRDPHSNEQFLHSPALSLNQEQENVFKRICLAIDEPENRKPFLLHGVTGSGKTEIYLQAMERVLERGQTALVLVPEISLTPQTVERFKSRFAQFQEQIAVLHSHLSQGERHDEWHKINNEGARIVIGARSAIFAPLNNLGLIVVDEEHENSYKQEETPRYHARDIAVLRGSMEKCTVILGSATPSLESYHNAMTGKYELLELKGRIDSSKLPFIRIVDMRQEAMRQKGSPVLSQKLADAIRARLEKKEQTILFLNRRGYSTSLLCSVCGHVCECPNCSVALTYHRAAEKIVCHICGHAAIAPKKCPGCKDPNIRYSGTGTERVEQVVQKFFPEAVVKRMDADAMTRKDSYRETLGAFRAGKIDILVGTQMIAKGLHFPNVTLVGIINADLALHLPDFRAGERTFQLLTQVAGRAGRGDLEGEVFVQSFTPFSPSIQFARHHDFQGFWEQEIEFREKWDYPPFTHMVLITLRSPHQTKASFSAETLARRLKESLPPGTVLSEPSPAPLEKAKGSYRFHLMLRASSITKLSRHLRKTLDGLTFPEEVIVTVDVDPYQLL